VVAALEAQAAAIAQAIQPILARRGGIGLISDAELLTP